MEVAAQALSERNLDDCHLVGVVRASRPTLPAGAAPAVPATAAAAAASGSFDLNVGSGSDSKPQASSTS
eukprot:3277410-Prymnesium_polylepis.1